MGKKVLLNSARGRKYLCTGEEDKYFEFSLEESTLNLCIGEEDKYFEFSSSKFELMYFMRKQCGDSLRQSLNL